MRYATLTSVRMPSCTSWKISSPFAEREKRTVARALRSLSTCASSTTPTCWSPSWLSKSAPPPLRRLRSIDCGEWSRISVPNQRSYGCSLEKRQLGGALLDVDRLAFHLERATNDRAGLRHLRGSSAARDRVSELSLGERKIVRLHAA
jgi:hypothetical protein